MCTFAFPVYFWFPPESSKPIDPSEKHSFNDITAFINMQGRPTTGSLNSSQFKFGFLQCGDAGRSAAAMTAVQPYGCGPRQVPSPFTKLIDYHGDACRKCAVRVVVNTTWRGIFCRRRISCGGGRFIYRLWIALSPDHVERWRSSHSLRWLISKQW